MQHDEQLFAMRHSGAHILAAAVAELYGTVRFGVGPVIENGFFYDLALEETLAEEDLKKIEKKMRDIIARDDVFRREELPIDEAISFFKEKGQTFKVELLNDLKEKGTTKVSEEEALDIGGSADSASVYYTGEFVDLCRGPHVAHAKEVGSAFTLTKVSGAYWRGKEENPQMQRVYGVLFKTQEELDAYLHMIEEAKRRDHRKLGKELDLFVYSPLVGSGLPMFTQKGNVLREKLTEFVWSLMKPHGYQKVWIPHIAKTDLYKTSGHWDKFADDIFHVTSKKTDDAFVMKPMNCPHHTQIFASQPRSYRDLPIRMSEVTTVYRDENTGQLQGLTRVRSITQDDAHVFCRPDQIHAEIGAIQDIIKKFYRAFDMSLRVTLSTRDREHPEKYLGEASLWDEAEDVLKGMLEESGTAYTVEPGEAAFYGPKIDYIAKDAIGREWQLATVQLDFNQPERFGLEYADSDGSKKRPVMIHRAISGSLERFSGVLIEHFEGAFPLWLAPVQLRLVTVSDQFAEAAEALAAQLRMADIRVEVDASDEKVGKKIRNAAMQKIPWTIVMGEKEAKGGAFQVNVFGQEEDLVIEPGALIAQVQAASKLPQ